MPGPLAAPRPRLAGIHVSAGGVPKRPVPAARVGVAGVEGDRQRDLRFHGGPARAVCLYALERIEALAAEGHPIAPGSTGENLTIEGLEWGLVVPGVELRVGPDVRLAVTSFTVPCTKIAASFADGEFHRISQKLHPGWSRVYARVLAPGTARVGDEIVLIEGRVDALE